VFGRDRPATGFAIDLKALMESSAVAPSNAAPIVAPPSDDPALRDKVAMLRAAGSVVVIDVAPGVDIDGAARLVKAGAEWVVEGSS